MKRKILKVSLSVLAVTGLGLLAGGDEVNAHGYIESPPSRGYQGVLDRNTLGWFGALEKYGNVITNPQSLEARKGFPQSGPADGRIASAEGGLGQINDFVLDNQSADRWVKQEVSQGPIRIDWHYTAPHRTTKWHYYITKPGWNQNAPLTRDSLELISTINHDGSLATNSPIHTINIPEDRLGYHIILGVWDVEDTANAFYNVIDVNISTDSIVPELPQVPENFRADRVTSQSVSLTWNSQSNVQKYNVFRDGELIATTISSSYLDEEVLPNTNYTYQVQAIAFNGLESNKTANLNVTTKKETKAEIPSAPGNLHSMGVTKTSVSLMWRPSNHSAGIKEYQIFRDDVQIASTPETMYDDSQLNPGTSYIYKIRSISHTGEISEFSNSLQIKTENDETTSNNREWILGSFSSPTVYTAGEEISHLGKDYIVLQTHLNYGDPNWSPNNAFSLFIVK